MLSSPSSDRTSLAQTAQALENSSDSFEKRDLGELAQARKSLNACQSLLPKRSLAHFSRDLATALVFATFGAIAIRSCWFELYYVPTGSMRPTIKEQDRLIVTKTAFGINRPFSATPLFFDADRLQRGQIVTFTSQNLDMEGATRHFGLFPGYRRLVKRLWAKGDDLVYFYGGEIYILDAKGRAFHLPGNNPNLENLEVIPLISFLGRVKRVFENGRLQLTMTHFGMTLPQKNSGGLPWGLENYALAKALMPQAVPIDQRKKAPDAPLWLEIHHHARQKPLSFKSQGDLRPWEFHQSYLPLSSHHVDRLQSALTTSRFVVQSQMARRPDSPLTSGIHLPGVPDGVFEFDQGIASAIKMGGQGVVLKSDHPLLQRCLLPALFNAGIDFDPIALSQSAMQMPPLRTIYYRCGALRTMGTELMRDGDQDLSKFIQSELSARAKRLNYAPFVDQRGSSIAQDVLNPEWMRKKGLKIPPNHTLLLGDNSPRSSDSRDFGFVPETNIQGSPLFIFWPLSSAIKGLKRPPLPWLTLYRLSIWLIVLFSVIGYRLWQRARMRKVVAKRPWRQLAL